MASNIKGIVIEIEGKTSGLVSALKDVDKSVKETQTALKKVNEALKLDPKNVTLVAEKQKLLQQQIDNTSERLKYLEQAAKDAEEALANGDISEAEYAQLAAEVELCRQELEKLNNEAKGNNAISQAFEEAGQKIEEVGKKVEDVGDKMKTFGDNMTKYVTGPIVAGGGLAVASFVEVDKGLDTIIKKTGSTGEELEEFKSIMNDIATTIPADFDTVGNAVGEVNTRFKVTGDDLEELSIKFLEFAQLNGTDVTQSIDDVQRAMSAWNISTEDTGKFLDYLNAVGQDTGISMTTLTNVLSDNAETFQQMNLSASEALDFLGQIELSGADVSDVMAGLKKSLKEASEEGVPFDEALAQIQSDLQNAGSDMEAYNRAVETFGNKGAGQIVNAVQNGQLAFDGFSSSLEDNAGNIEKTYGATISATDKVKTTTNQLKITMGDIGQTIAEMVAPAIEELAEGLRNLNEWWNSLSDGQREFIIGALAVVASIGPIIAIIGGLISGLGSVITAVGVITSALGATGLAATFAALAPVIGTVVAAITAVVAIGWGLYEIITGIIEIANNWDFVMETVGENVKAVFGSIGDWWSEKTAGIKADIDLTTQGFEQFKNDVSAKWETMKENASSAWDNIKGNVGDALTNMKESASEKVDAIGGFFKGLGDSALTWGADLLQNFIDGLKSMWNSFTGTIDDITGYIADNLGFSEPSEGPLSNFHTFSPDLIDLWNEGIYNNLGKVQESSEAMAQTVSNGIQTTDYSSSLNNISGQLSSMAGNGQPINVYIGSDRIGTAIARSNARTAYISGGR